MVLKFAESHLTQLKQHARSTYPQECCGVIVGDRATQTVSAVHAVRNAWTPDCLPLEFAPAETSHSSHDRYWIDPADLLRLMKASRAEGAAILGIYHSHPDHAAIPSVCDRQLAWPEYVYVILAVNSSQVTDCRCWQLDQSRQFQAVPFTRIASL